MRYLTPILVILLIVSLIANGVMYAKWRSHRAIFTVNGVGVSKLELEGYLEQTFGPQFKMLMTRRILVDDAAKKAKLEPTDVEVQEQYDQQKELDYKFANLVRYNPWLADEKKREIRENIEVNRLLTKDIPVTEDEIKTEYATHPERFDTPAKAHTNMAIILNEAFTNDIMKLLETKGSPVKPSVIMNNYPKDVVFIGSDYVMTIPESPSAKAIFDMKPNDVKLLNPLQELISQGAKKTIVKLLDIVPGKKADMNDKKTHERVRMSVAASRAANLQEFLSDLWANCKFESEEPNDKTNIEMQMFPTRLRGNK